MNILLVEDDRDSRFRLGNFLRELGHHVEECDNGYDALCCFKAGKFHMVLSDIKMPKMTGLELLREITRFNSCKEADVVLFTGHGDINSAIEALRAGASDYLLKPINIEELADLVERVAEQRMPPRENIPVELDGNGQANTDPQDGRKLSSLRKACARTVGIGEIGIFSESMKTIFRQAAKFSTDRSIPVLIQGETGTGKEVVARYIHFGYNDVTKPFVDINCAALSPGIFESEIFGYEAGAFTGGLAKGQRGKLDLAEGGTIFLDEITELPLELQAKLLRVIQERDFYRVGGLKKIKADARIICATNVDIEKKVQEGVFRQDLYFRLNVGRLNLPPLRERTEEILPLANMFLLELGRKRGKQFKRIGNAAAGMLLAHSWPGNVRELINTMEWVTFMHDDIELKPSHLVIPGQLKTDYSFQGGSHTPVLDPVNFSLPAQGLDLECWVREIVRQALAMHNGNKTDTARYLGISRSSLYCHLKRLEK